ncbi:hypothetical protein JOD47_002643 [Arthrobacter tumbae]|nr:hypothetical protein [Arthrobacter tumbae]
MGTVPALVASPFGRRVLTDATDITPGRRRRQRRWVRVA